jgi:protocatechuate 3,4-dioxygenase beta subunit
LTETTGPTAWAELMGGSLADLTTQHKGVPLGQRIVVGGRVMDDEHRPVANIVIEIWQANSAGRYIHVREETRCHRVRLVPASRARSAAERAIC